MKVFMTGATGFIGGYVARKLRERGDHVVALVRNPSKAFALEGIGCEVIPGDVEDQLTIDIGTRGADLAIHLAADFRVGITADEWPRMQDINVGGTRKFFDSAVEAGVGRILYVSTVNVFGNTRGAVVDESFQRIGGDFLSYYDQSKHTAHQIAQNRIAKGAPVVIVQPGLVYGPGDHFEVGKQIVQAGQGVLSSIMFGDLGLTMAYVEDVATGLIAAADRGRVGESYILGGPTARLGEVLTEAARLGGHPEPVKGMPVGMLRAMAPLGPFIGPKLGLPKNLKEVVRASDGVTYFAKSDKAIEELGYLPRSLEAGLRATLEAAHVKLQA